MPKKKAKQSNQNSKTQYLTQQNNPSSWKFNEEERKRLKDFLIKEQSEKILFYAISAKDLAAVKTFSEKGFTIPNYKNDLKFPFYESLLLEDNVELLKYLIEELNFNLKDLACLNNNTLLNVATAKGADKCIKLLIDKGYDINQYGYYISNTQNSPLQIAIMANKPKIAKLLLTNNAEFDQNTFGILVTSSIPTKDAHDILDIVQKSSSNLKDLKKTYTKVKRGVKPNELKITEPQSSIEFNLINNYLNQVLNDYYKLVVLEDDKLLPRIIKNSETLIKELENTKFLNKDLINNAMRNLLSSLTDIYKSLIIEHQQQEKFENFLTELLDKLNDKPLILEFNKLVIEIYNNAGNPEKIIKHGAKVYSVLKNMSSNLKEKYQILTQLISACSSVEMPDKLKLYEEEKAKLINENPGIKEIIISDIKDILAGGVQDTIIPTINYRYSDFIQYFVKCKLETYQSNKEWEAGYKFLEGIDSSLPDFINDKFPILEPRHYDPAELAETQKKQLIAAKQFKLNNHPDLKYYEFVFYYHKDKNSPKAKQVLKDFYNQALTSENELWQKNISKLYEIAIYQELEDKNTDKVKSYLKDLDKLPKTEDIKALKKEVQIWLKNLKKSQTNIVIKDEVDNNSEEINILQQKIEDNKNPLEETILRLPKNPSTSFDEIELLLASENFEEISKIEQKLIRKYFTYKKLEALKQAYIEKDEKLKFSWCVNGKVYKSEEIQQIDNKGKYYATISEDLDLGKIKLEKYQAALEKGLAAREKGCAGIKVKEGRFIKLKINKDDNRLITDKLYKNSHGANLIIFEDEKPHNQIKNTTVLHTFDVPDDLEVQPIGEVV